MKTAEEVRELLMRKWRETEKNLTSSQRDEIEYVKELIERDFAFLENANEPKHVNFGPLVTKTEIIECFLQAHGFRLKPAGQRTSFYRIVL